MEYLAAVMWDLGHGLFTLMQQKVTVSSILFGALPVKHLGTFLRYVNGAL